MSSSRNASSPTGRPTTPEERRHAVFHLDKTRILDADVFVLDGRVPEEGACVELGIAYCQ